MQKYVDLWKTQHSPWEVTLLWTGAGDTDFKKQCANMGGPGKLGDRKKQAPVAHLPHFLWDLCVSQKL